MLAVGAPKHHAVAVFTREAGFSCRVVGPSSRAQGVPVCRRLAEWFARAGPRRLEIFLCVERIADQMIE